jgi:3',5'-cyclic-AMP phosphodiesterase
MTQNKNFRLGWITDPHLNFCSKTNMMLLKQAIAKQQLDALVVTGDIAEGNIIYSSLMDLKDQVFCKIYFVLGNHDYYMSSISQVREVMTEHFVDLNPHMPQWLTGISGDFVSLSPGKVALCGHDGWYDGRYANWFKSKVLMSDYHVIADFKFLTMELLHQRIGELAKESADFAKRVLPLAFQEHDHVFFATHVPVFKENAVYNGMISDDDWMPHFSNKYLGDALLEVMESYPTKKLTVLQGHSHGKTKFIPKSNIESITGFAKYRFPALNQVFEF